MDSNEIHELIKNLKWSTSENLRNDAVKRLTNIEESELHMLLQPISKSYWENAAIVLKKIGYPRVKSVIPGLLEWIQDINWPGAQHIIEVLATVDSEAITYVREVFKSGDGIWIKWLLSEVISKWSIELINEIKGDLLNLANALDYNLIIEDVDIQSMKLLYESRIMTTEEISNIIERKKGMYRQLLEGLQELSDLVNRSEN
ncbi:MAG: DUF5071 domain-containing protein [Bacillota bacterium]|nr:DUF5071 domain-containing protein [Bacillota bacterium]